MKASVDFDEGLCSIHSFPVSLGGWVGFNKTREARTNFPFPARNTGHAAAKLDYSPHGPAAAEWSGGEGPSVTCAGWPEP